MPESLPGDDSETQPLPTAIDKTEWSRLATTTGLGRPGWRLRTRRGGREPESREKENSRRNWGRRRRRVVFRIVHAKPTKPTKRVGRM